MTIGQRIAQKRKELGLSQEALGIELGVSRQSIYKWESDSSLPEVEKLIALAKRFGVSIGWLLGVEESPETADAAAPAEPQELTDTQLQMVDEIVRRYLAAQPKPPRRKKWPFVLAAGLILIAGISLFSRLERLDDNYNSLQSSMSHINSNVNSQISGISYRVEEILKAQNALTAEYGAELTDVRLFDGGSKARIEAHATPKTFAAGTTAEFLLDNGEDTVAVPCEPDDAGKFSVSAECGLTDSITVSVVFIAPDGTRQTQLLDEFGGYFSATFPYIEVSNHGHFFTEELPDGVLTLDGQHSYVTTRDHGVEFGDAEAAEIKVGLCRNRELLYWAEPCAQPETFQGFEGYEFYRLPAATIEGLQPGETLEFIALITDNYGRQYVTADIPLLVEQDPHESGLRLTYPNDGRYSHDPADWALD